MRPSKAEGLMRLAGLAIPDDRGFALIGNADCANIICAQTRLFNCGPTGACSSGPQIRRGMLDPARGGEMLRKFFLRHRLDLHIGVKTIARLEVVSWSIARMWCSHPLVGGQVSGQYGAV